MLIKLETHSARVKGLSFHNRQPWILAGLHSGLIQIWDYRSNIPVETFQEHTGPVRTVNFHNRQPLFVSGGDDQKVKVWNYKSKKSLFTLYGHFDYVRVAVFHKDHPWIASCSDDQSIKVWNWQGRSCLATLTGHNHYVMCVEFHPEEDLLLSASLDQTIRIWDLNGLKTSNGGFLRVTLNGHASGVNWASFHQNLALVISGGDDNLVKLWRYEGDKAWEVSCFRNHHKNVSSVGFCRNQDLAVSVSEDKTIKIWDLITKNCVYTHRRVNDRFWILAEHPEQRIFAAGHDSGLLVFKFEKERPVCCIAHDSLFYVKDKAIRKYSFETRKDMQILPLINHQWKKSILSISVNKTKEFILITFETKNGNFYEMRDLIEGKTYLHLCGVVAKFFDTKSFAAIENNRRVSLYIIQKNDIKKLTTGITTDFIYTNPFKNSLITRNEERLVFYKLTDQDVLGYLAASLETNEDDKGNKSKMEFCSQLIKKHLSSFYQNQHSNTKINPQKGTEIAPFYEDGEEISDPTKFDALSTRLSSYFNLHMAFIQADGNESSRSFVTNNSFDETTRSQVTTNNSFDDSDGNQFDKKEIDLSRMNVLGSSFKGNVDSFAQDKTSIWNRDNGSLLNKKDKASILNKQDGRNLSQLDAIGNSNLDLDEITKDSALHKSGLNLSSIDVPGNSCKGNLNFPQDKILAASSWNKEMERNLPDLNTAENFIKGRSINLPEDDQWSKMFHHGLRNTLLGVDVLKGEITNYELNKSSTALKNNERRTGSNIVEDKSLHKNSDRMEKFNAGDFLKEESTASNNYKLENISIQNVDKLSMYTKERTTNFPREDFMRRNKTNADVMNVYDRNPESFAKINKAIDCDENPESFMRTNFDLKSICDQNSRSFARKNEPNLNLINCDGNPKSVMGTSKTNSNLLSNFDQNSGSFAKTNKANSDLAYDQNPESFTRSNYINSDLINNCDQNAGGFVRTNKANFDVMNENPMISKVDANKPKKVSLVGKIRIKQCKFAIWSNDYSRVVLISRNQLLFCEEDLQETGSIKERHKIKSGAWDGNWCFIYTTTHHLKYSLTTGQSGIIRTLDVPIYLIKVEKGRIHCFDKNSRIKIFSVDPTEYLFKLALCRGNTEDILDVFRNKKLVGQSIISYLDENGFTGVALEFVRDPSTTFHLALKIGKMRLALKAACDLNCKEIWLRLATEALQWGFLDVAEIAYQKGGFLDKLLFLYLISGNFDKIRRLIKESDLHKNGRNQDGLENANFHEINLIAKTRHFNGKTENISRNYHFGLLLGDINLRIQSLLKARKNNLAQLTAVLHNSPDTVENTASDSSGETKINESDYSKESNKNIGDNSSGNAQKLNYPEFQERFIDESNISFKSARRVFSSEELAISSKVNLDIFGLRINKGGAKFFRSPPPIQKLQNWPLLHTNV